MENQKKELLSIVIPVFNEETVVPLFLQRLEPILCTLNENYRFEILFLNNASTDMTLEAIKSAQKSNKSIEYITLSKNVGYQKSLLCGLQNARGKIIVIIDVDCEDPPEMILDFIKQYENGFDLVYGIRTDRPESFVLKKLRNLFYRIMKAFSDDEVILYMAEFALMTDEFRDAAIDSRDTFPFLRSSLSRVGFRRVGIPYKREKRIKGNSHYNLASMFTFAVGGILSSTTLPLRILLYLFPLFSLLLGSLFFWYLSNDSEKILVAVCSLICIYFAFALSMISIYLARTYRNSQGRPNFHIHKRYSSPSFRAKSKYMRNTF